jgi:serine/threonine protein kinase
VKVLDFGIAKIVRESEIDNMELTQAGQMIGTFDYMAPEQMVGGQCTERTDIYTLGVVMYEMISGRRPFADATSPTAMLASLLTLSPSPLSAFVEVPAELDRILLRCLEREPGATTSSRTRLGAARGRRGRDPQIKTPAPVMRRGHGDDSRRGVHTGRQARSARARHTRRDPHKAGDIRGRREPQTPSPNVIRAKGRHRDRSARADDSRAERERGAP